MEKSNVGLNGDSSFVPPGLNFKQTWNGATKV